MNSVVTESYSYTQSPLTKLIQETNDTYNSVWRDCLGRCYLSLWWMETPLTVRKKLLSPAPIFLHQVRYDSVLMRRLPCYRLFHKISSYSEEILSDFWDIIQCSTWPGDRPRAWSRSVPHTVPNSSTEQHCLENGINFLLSRFQILSFCSYLLLPALKYMQLHECGHWQIWTTIDSLWRLLSWELVAKHLHLPSALVKLSDCCRVLLLPK